MAYVHPTRASTLARTFLKPKNKNTIVQSRMASGGAHLTSTPLCMLYSYSPYLGVSGQNREVGARCEDGLLVDGREVQIPGGHVDVCVRGRRAVRCVCV